MIHRPLTYDHTWRDRLAHFYAIRGGECYWAFNFERLWQKFQRGVQEELELADVLGHWVNFPRARVLVIGSHLGAEAIAYALRGAHVIGIDLDEAAQTIAQDRARQHRALVDFRVMNGSRTTFPDGYFDYVSCAQVLEHLPPEQQPQMLAEIWRLVRPGGCFWIDTPNQLALMDQHDTGLPFIHWLPRKVKVPLAGLLGRNSPFKEPAFDWQRPGLHHYLSYPGLKRELQRLGTFEILSRYHGHADVDHYAQVCRARGRGEGLLFRLKLTLLRGLLRMWDFNILTGMRLMIRKKREGAVPALSRVRRAA